MEDLAPPIPLDLVTWLDARFPERTPGPSETLDEIRLATGRREVVRFLLHKHLEQTEEEPPHRIDPDV